jgi:hypothetical protein
MASLDAENDEDLQKALLESGEYSPLFPLLCKLMFSLLWTSIL